MTKNQIGQAEFAASYALAREWMSGKLSRSEAVASLARNHGLNPVSAGDLLQALRAMSLGEGFTRSISAAAADYYVTRIADDDGPDAARLAITSIAKHIEYYESVQPSTMHKMRAMLDSLNALIPKVARADDLSDFEAEVAKFAAMPTEERAKVLPPKGHKPEVTLAQIKVYKRSPAVVAQVQLRAGGKCETCAAPAPFMKASNGKPFLEVHHNIRLSEGGDDTVENAIAVCPNCHRKHHFG